MTGDLLVRGCILENTNEELCHNATTKCEKCSETGCNSRSYHGLKCIKCNFETDYRCQNSSESMYPKLCISSNMNDLACFLMKKGTFLLSFLNSTFET